MTNRLKKEQEIVDRINKSADPQRLEKMKNLFSQPVIASYKPSAQSAEKRPEAKSRPVATTSQERAEIQERTIQRIMQDYKVDWEQATKIYLDPL